MSWSMKCCECKNEKFEFFDLINHKPYTEIEELRCMVCNSLLIHKGYGWTELKEQNKKCDKCKGPYGHCSCD